MPELPEVEAVVRAIRDKLPGRTITDAASRQPKAINLPPDEFRERVLGRRILGVARRAKSTVVQLEQGSLWLHMGLRGRILLTTDAAVEMTVCLNLDDGSRFGLANSFMGHVHYFSTDEAAARDASLGIDPFDPMFTLQRLAEIVRAKPKSAAKAVLMDQSLVAGVGNIYTDEALHRAGVRPTRKCADLGEADIGQVWEAVRQVLTEAVEARGAEGYLGDPEGPGGYEPRIHGREECAVCGTPAVKLTAAGRTAYYCPKCQPS